MKETGNDKLRVLVIYPHFGHYRLPIIRALAGSKVADFIYASGFLSNMPGLKLIRPETPVTNQKTFADVHIELRNIWIKNALLWQRGLIRLQFRRDIDVVIFMGTYHYVTTWIAAAIARMTGKRVLMWGHGFTRMRTSPRDRVRMWFYRLAHGHLLYGFRARGMMTEHGFSPDDLYVIYNSLDLEAQLAAYDRLVSAPECRDGSEGDAIRLVYVGRVTARKQLHVLIDAVALLMAAGRTVRCRIIGDGAALPGLNEQTERLGLSEAISFPGSIYDENELCAELADADLCVVPAMVGLTCVHAMAYGLPVIINDDIDGQGPEAEAVVEGKTGSHFKQGDAADLAEKIVAWIERKVPREEISSICRAMVIDCYNPDVQRGIIEDAVRGRPAGAPATRAESPQ